MIVTRKLAAILAADVVGFSALRFTVITARPVSQALTHLAPIDPALRNEESSSSALISYAPPPM
jgi:hypothetical protein